MRSLMASIAAAGATFALAGIGHAQSDPNPAVNNPDRQSWELFMTVNTAASGPNNNNAVFETWASDGDTFKPTPAWPVGQPQVEIGERALGLVLRRAHPRISPQVLPGGRDLVGEETRRNRPDFDFIVNNNLFRVSGLEAAFQAGKPIAFPVDLIEVKANWVAVDRLKEFNGFDGSPAEAAKAYHINSADGKPYALVSFHIISKLVPNWTWATFEHKDNPGRCDVIGCRDTFGAATQDVAPLSPVEFQHALPRLREDAGGPGAVCSRPDRSGVRQLLSEGVASGLHRFFGPCGAGWKLGDREWLRVSSVLHVLPCSRGVRHIGPCELLRRLRSDVDREAE